MPVSPNAPISPLLPPPEVRVPASSFYPGLEVSGASPISPISPVPSQEPISHLLDAFPHTPSSIKVTSPSLSGSAATEKRLQFQLNTHNRTRTSQQPQTHTRGAAAVAYKARRRRRRQLCYFLWALTVTTLAAISLGLGLHVRSRSHKSGNEKEMGPAGSNSTKHVDGPTIRDKSGLAAISTTPGALFVQIDSGEVMKSSFDENGAAWNEVLGFKDAKKGTALAAVSWNDEKEVRVFFWDVRGRLRHWAWSKDAGRWNEVSMQKGAEVEGHDKSALAVVFYEKTTELRVYYQSPELKLVELALPANPNSTDTGPGAETTTMRTLASAAREGTAIAATTVGTEQIRVYYEKGGGKLDEACLETACTADFPNDLRLLNRASFAVGSWSYPTREIKILFPGKNGYLRELSWRKMGKQGKWNWEVINSSLKAGMESLSVVADEEGMGLYYGQGREVFGAEWEMKTRKWSVNGKVV